jgi:DNA-directed RNA polymerase subunit RPC12/RpoP
MLTYRCDKCKKDIADKKEMVVAGKGNFADVMLCAPCGKPILRFLTRKGLIVQVSFPPACAKYAGRRKRESRRL